jgi:hypothetical protein
MFQAGKDPIKIPPASRGSLRKTDGENQTTNKRRLTLGRRPTHNQLAQVEATMAPAGLTETNVKSQIRKLSGIGATEDQIDMRGTIGQRIDNKGTKVEDEAGTGQIDSSGG